jgi:hypothetical protein
MWSSSVIGEQRLAGWRAVGLMAIETGRRGAAVSRSAAREPTSR